MGSNILVLKMKSSFLVTYLILGVSLSCADDFSLDKALTKLDITPDVFEKLVKGSRNVKRDTITNLLKKQLNKQGLILDVTPAEVRLSQNLPNQCQDTTSCGCRVESRDVQVFAAIQRTSKLTTRGKAFEDAGIIIEAIIDAELGASGNIRAKGNLRDLKDIKLRKKRSPGFGKRFKKAFKKTWKQVVKNPIKKINRELIERPIKKIKCARLVRKTIGFNLRSTGVIKLGIRINLGDITLDETDEGLTLSVTPSFDIIGKILSWNLDEVTASKCVERIAGLKLISYCGYLERKARKKIEESMQKVQNVKLPAVIQKLERKLQMKAGKTISVKIPLDYMN